MALYLHSRFMELRTYAKRWLGIFYDSSNQKNYTKTKEERSAALKRHLEFFNTHPYISPILGVTLALEEERANGAPVDDVAIQRG